MTIKRISGSFSKNIGGFFMTVIFFQKKTGDFLFYNETDPERLTQNEDLLVFTAAEGASFAGIFNGRCSWE